MSPSVDADLSRWDWDTLGSRGRRFKLLQCDGLSCHSKSMECVIPECWLLRRVAHVWRNMKAPDLLSLAREKRIHGAHCQGRPKQALPS